MELLDKQFKKTQKAIKKHGRGSAQAQIQLQGLGESFQFFKFVPKHYTR